MRSTQNTSRNLHTVVGNQGARRRVPKNESPRERFKRIAAIRLANAERAINLLEHLGSTSTYDMRPSEAQQIVESLKSAASKVETALHAGGPRSARLKFDD